MKLQVSCVTAASLGLSNSSAGDQVSLHPPLLEILRTVVLSSRPGDNHFISIHVNI